MDVEIIAIIAIIFDVVDNSFIKLKIFFAKIIKME
jgi:hypothetical protein